MPQPHGLGRFRLNTVGSRCNLQVDPDPARKYHAPWSSAEWPRAPPQASVAQNETPGFRGSLRRCFRMPNLPFLEPLRGVDLKGMDPLRAARIISELIGSYVVVPG